MRARRILLALLATIGLSGLAPTIAAADTHTRTAPYDFGERCYHMIGVLGQDGMGECVPDPIAMTTGAVDRVAVCNFNLPGCLSGPGLASEWSTVGIFVDVDSPGTLTVTVAAYVGGRLCLRVFVGGYRVHCDSGPGPVSLQVVAEVPVGHYRVSVFPTTSLLAQAVAATVNTITYEIAP